MISNLLNFDPNAGQTQHAWATYVPYRNPQFKVHAQRRHAISALSGRGSGLLFKHNGTKWVEIGRFPTLAKRDLAKEWCDHCGNKCDEQEDYRTKKKSWAGSVKIVEVATDEFEAQFWCTWCKR